MHPPRPGGDAGDPLIGRLLDGRYRIGGRIARGGMASVYEATDTRLDRVVAVKVMHPGMGDDHDFVARFVREARAAARLSHVNVVGVYDQGEDAGSVYLVMELVAGHTLRDVIRKEAPMSPARALALLEPVLSALAAAHRAGLIHRDIKPENVLIADDGRVKVADFGLAKAVSADTQHTATGGVLIGTVSYLAPELVVDGRSDARADVYAAGVVLYELLTGRKPHEGESPIQVAYKHVHEDVPVPSEEIPGLPAYVDALVARATARDRDQRPADASVLLHQVHRVSQTLADGVLEDDELTADLLPRRVRVSPDDQAFHDTAPDSFDRAAVPAPTPAADRTVQVEHAVASDAMRPAPDDGREHTSVVELDHPAPRRRRGRGPLVLLLVLLLVAALGGGAWWFGYARYTPVPGVIGLTEAKAVQRLEAAGLEVKVGDGAYSETVAADLVLSTDPEAGDKALDGDVVTLTLSLGKERYEVPKLRGRTEQQAEQALEDTNLSVGRAVERYHETIPAGTVLGSDPKAGTSLRRGIAVSLVVSKGPKPIKIRDWTGKDADDAIAWFDDKSLVVEQSEENSDDVAEGDVISQSPASGTLFGGDTVTIVVSEGPELVEVPGGLVASGVDAATEKLEAAGFEVDIKDHTDYLGLGYVFRVSPGSGDMVPKGSTITLYLI
ncbi:Stk1 family PASTA domain-containing Ser/Thr kinase [Myroides odoratimimus subsp. xuanwuensis]